MTVPARVSLFVYQCRLAASVTKCRMRDLIFVTFTSNDVIGIYHGSFQVMSENLPEIIQAGRSLNPYRTNVENRVSS